MSFEFVPESIVKSPKGSKPRRGRGFSLGETREAGLDVLEARQMGVIVDERRRTVHPENVEILKQYIKDFEKLADEVLAEAKKPAEKKISSAEAIEELSSIRAVKKEEAQALFDAGIKSLSDLAYCDIEKTAKKSGIDEERITLMVKAALKKV
ncbi:MAG: hypothetical protein EAX95_06285 [Candidatus Thorarchaeota archaeon]|nr:hypothetical protein [Candidatus Thorarchaeota archaeon]